MDPDHELASIQRDGWDFFKGFPGQVHPTNRPRI
jgi:hypothetical protein